MMTKQNDEINFPQRFYYLGIRARSMARRDRINEQEGNGPKDEQETMVMASEVKFDFGSELCDLKYPDIH